MLLFSFKKSKNNIGTEEIEMELKITSTTDATTNTTTNEATTTTQPEKKKCEYEYIRSLRLAGWLQLHGFRILRIHHNLKVANKDVYLFRTSERLTECMFEYMKKKKNHEKVEIEL